MWSSRKRVLGREPGAHLHISGSSLNSWSSHFPSSGLFPPFKVAVEITQALSFGDLELYEAMWWTQGSLLGYDRNHREVCLLFLHDIQPVQEALRSLSICFLNHCINITQHPSTRSSPSKSPITKGTDTATQLHWTTQHLGKINSWKQAEERWRRNKKRLTNGSTHRVMLAYSNQKRTDHSEQRC